MLLIIGDYSEILVDYIAQIIQELGILWEYVVL